MPDAELKKRLERHYELDWLRVFAVLLLMFFHTARIFNDGWFPFHIMNDESSRILDVLIDFMHMWHMPLFFLISGAGTWFALEFRGKEEYRKERIYRLLIPLLFGILILIPPQVYFERLQKLQFTGTYLEFYPHFFEGIYPKGNFTWNHLWFLFYLFIFSMVGLKLFVKMKTEEGKYKIKKIAEKYEKGRAIFLLAVPIIMIEIALRGFFPFSTDFVTDWANVFHYFTIFIFGFFLFADKRFARAVSRNKQLALIIGIIISIIYLVIVPFSNNALFGFRADPSFEYLKLHSETIILYILRMTFRAIGEWCLIIVFIGYSKKYFPKRSRILTYLSSIAFPFYLIHQTIIIIVGFYIVQLSLNIFFKYIIICFFSLIFSVICSEIVKYSRATRFMFGMKQKKVYPIEKIKVKRVEM